MDESESSLKDGSDELSFLCLQRFHFLMRFFFFDIESDGDVFDDKSDNDGSGSGFASGSFLYSFFELSIYRVNGLSCIGVTKSVCRVSGIFSVSRSQTSIVSSLEFLI